MLQPATIECWFRQWRTGPPGNREISRWDPDSLFIIPGAIHLFQYVTNQPPKANSAFHPSEVGK